MKTRLPGSLITTILVVLGTGLFVALAWLNIIPLESLFLNLLNIILSVVAVALLAAIGGIFLGMFLAHRMLATREFSPVERAMMEASHDIKALTARVEKLETTLMERLQRLEERDQREAREELARVKR